MSELSELRKEMGELTKLATRTDANVRWIREAVDHEVRRSDDHEKRIRWLERFGSWVSGAAGAVGVLLGFSGGNQLKP